MKKKDNFLIIMLCLIVLLLVDYFNFSRVIAADNLKALKEQYMFSYNKFVKALKDGADQEKINKLTEKCKIDYAAYQKALKSLKSFKNIDDTSMINTSSANYSQSLNQQLVNDSDNQKVLKPLRINEPIKTPKRIGAIIENSSFQPTPLPSDEELLKVDGTITKVQYVNRIKQMHSTLISDENCYLKNEMDYLLLNGNNYPDLCSLAILFYAEGEIKKIVNNAFEGFSDAALLEYELNLRKTLLEAIEVYSQDKNMKYTVCQGVCNAILKKLELLDKHIGIQRTKVEQNIKTSISLITQARNDLITFETKIYNSNDRPAGRQIIERCSSIIKSYRVLIDSNLALENYIDAKKYFYELNTFYQKTIKKQYIISYSNTTGTYKEIINICKTPDEYVSTLNYYFTSLSKNEINSVNYDDIKSDLKLFQDYAEAIPHESEYDVPMPWMKTTASDLYDKISRPYVISKLTFAKYGKYYPSDFSNVLDSETDIELRFRSSRELLNNETFSIEVKSLTSLRKMTVSKFKKSNFLKDKSIYEYYALFRPIIGSKDKDLIRYDDDFKESIACFNGEFYNKNLMDLYNTNDYFFKDGKHNIFGFSNSQFLTYNFEKLIFPNSKDFLKAGGAEYIETAPIQNKVAIALAKHQADWFIIDAHGWRSNWSGGIVESRAPNAAKVTPKELIDCKDYAKNIDVLVLDACHCLKWYDTTEMVFAKGWYNVLPQGLILGYQDTITVSLGARVIEELHSTLNAGKIHPEQLAFEWELINKKLFENYINGVEGFSNFKTAKYFSYIYKNQWKTSIRKKMGLNSLQFFWIRKTRSFN